MLETLLDQRQRAPDNKAPLLATIEDVQHRLSSQDLYIAITACEDVIHAVSVQKKEPPQVLNESNPGRLAQEQYRALRAKIEELVQRYRQGMAVSVSQRHELDGLLEQLGQGPLGQLLHRATADAQGSVRSVRLVVALDNQLSGIPLHALRDESGYLVERVSVAYQFSGSMFVRPAAGRQFLRQLCIGVSEARSELPEADREVSAALKTFWWRRHLRADAATRTRIRRLLRFAKVAHFACHAEFDEQRPSASRLCLPSSEHWHASEWVGEPVAGLPLVTLSACRSAATAGFLGQETFGLAAGLQAGGARAVLAGLWPLADAENAPIMTSFYRHRRTTDLAAALANTQREAIAAGCSPLFWAPLVLYGDSAALRPCPRVLRWLVR
jgi:CHAT domain-containing protein